MIERAFTQFIKNENLEKQTIGIALSGGADSVALLHAAISQSTLLKISLCVLHVNYHLRNEESQEDEAFVRSLCEQLSIPCYVYDADISDEKSALEEQARNIRYDFFQRSMVEGLCDVVATAHSANDQAETLLFRLARGTGIEGIVGIQARRRDGIIRPFLSVARKDILEYLHKHDHTWREDSSNATDDFARNTIRHQVLPVLETLNSQAIKHLSDFGQRAINVKEELTPLIRSHHKKQLILYRQKDMSTELFYQALTLLHLTPSQALCDALVKNGKQTGACTLLPQGWSLYTLKEFLLFTPHFPSTPSPQKISQEASSFTYLSGLWEFEQEPSDETYKRDYTAQSITIAQHHFPLTLRSVTEDEQITPFGKEQSVLIQTLLKKQGYSQKEREMFPLFYAHDGAPLWIPGVVVGQDVSSDSDEQHYQISWLR